jgi:Flp pilus assembly protein protease CpaA
MPGLVVPFVIFTAVYIFLAIVVVLLLRRQFLETGNPVPGQPSGVIRA